MTVLVERWLAGWLAGKRGSREGELGGTRQTGSKGIERQVDFGARMSRRASCLEEWVF